MTDHELNQILQQALTPEIDDSEIVIQKNMEGRAKMKISTIVKPAVVAAACMALLISTFYVGDYFSTPETKNGVVSTPTDFKKNSFTITVQAKGKESKSLEKGKPVPVVSVKQGSLGWFSGGDGDKKEISYCMEAPLVCKGENIDTVTYEINKGEFLIDYPVNKHFILEATESKKTKDIRMGIENDDNKYERKCCTSYTVSAKKQGAKYVKIGDSFNVSKKEYDLIWKDHPTLKEELKARNIIFNNVKIKCTVTYKDGTKDTVDIAVSNDIMTGEEAGIADELEEKKAGKDDAKEKIVWTTFKML